MKLLISLIVLVRNAQIHFKIYIPVKSIETIHKNPFLIFSDTCSFLFVCLFCETILISCLQQQNYMISTSSRVLVLVKTFEI